MEKQIKVVVAGSGQEKDLAISPGATVGETLEEAGLPGYQLARKNEDPFAPDTDLHKEAAESETFYATPSKLAVGGGGSPSLSRFIAFLKAKKDFLVNRAKNILREFKDRLPVIRRRRVRVVRTKSFKAKIKKSRVRSKVRVIRNGKGARLTKTGKGLSYWQENGWINTKNGYHGYYKTCYGKWRGFVQENYKGNHSFYIFYPPIELKRSLHGPCFFNLGEGVYFIHFSKKPKDAGSGIIVVERVISESFSGKGD